LQVLAVAATLMTTSHCLERAVRTAAQSEGTFAGPVKLPLVSRQLAIQVAYVRMMLPTLTAAAT
jgi:hypothetical protein